MNAAEIRSLYAETLARAELASVSFIAHDGIRSTAMRTNEDAAQAALDALEAAGLLPAEADYRWMYEPDGTPLGYRERQFFTEWRDAAVSCSGCGVIERQCGRWRGGTRCCPECRHPTRKVAE